MQLHKDQELQPARFLPLLMQRGRRSMRGVVSMVR